MKIHTGSRNNIEITTRSLQALCLLNFFISDVRDGLGPFLGLYLKEHSWHDGSIGIAMTVSGLAGLIATFPAGLLTDKTTYKRLIIVTSTLLIICSTLLLYLFPNSVIVILSQFITGAAAAFVAPAIIGITLGITGQKGFTHQMGRNEAFNHAGNMASAVIAGIVSWIWGIGSVFMLMTFMAIGTMLSIRFINKNIIDHAQARGLNKDNLKEEKVVSIGSLFKMKSLMITGTTLLLFHLANAGLLPLLSLQAASGNIGEIFSTGTYAAATVVIAQLTMIPIAVITARYTSKYGYYVFVIIALAVLPVRALIAALWLSPWAIIPVQILDGFGAGIVGVAVPGLLAKILSKTGRINAGVSTVMVMQGLGAALSPSMAGMISEHYTYSKSFIAMGVIAFMGLMLWILSRKNINRALIS